MQNIKMYVAADETVGRIRDYANAKSAAPPTIMRGVEVCFKMRLFANSSGLEPYPISAFDNVVAWQWVMDKDFDEATSYILQADHSNISVATVTDVIDGIATEYTEISIPIPNTNTEELKTWIATERSKSGLTGELIGFDGDAKQVFVMQIEGFIARNRVAGAGDPTTIEPDYLTTAQVEALIASGVVVQFSLDGATDWHDTQVDEDRFIRIRSAVSASSAWSVAIKLIVGAKGADGESFTPDAVGILSERVSYDDEPKGFSFLDTDAGNLYFKNSADTADWSAPSPFRGQDGDDGVNGSKWYSETGLPSALIGIDGDYYLDNATGKVYHKASGAWVFESLLKGAPGTDGTDGLDGATWHFGAGVPAVELGVDGDAYLDTVNFNTYMKAAGTWTFKGTIKGDKGADGEGITPKGEYNPATDYILNDAVSHEGSFWRAKDATTGNAPPTLPNTSNTYWDIVIAKGENGNAADALQIKYAATADAVTWSVDYTAGDSFAIFSVDGGVTWTTAIRIKGADGVSSYAYIAYASDSSGTGFSLTPTDALKYRAEIKSSTELTPPTSTDFASAVWVKYIGEDGASTANAVSVVSSGFTGNLSTDIETVQDALEELDALELGSGGGLELGETATTAHRGDHGKAAYDHSQASHAPSDAQKNSDITKAEIEAKLIGEIASHTHADSGLTDAPSDNEIYGRKNAEWAKVVIPDATLNLPMLFALPSKLEGDPALHFAIEFHETDDYSGTAVYSIDTGTSQTGVKVLDGTAWVAFPAGGAGTLFYGNPIKVEYNVLMGGAPKNVRYKLYLAGDDPTVQPWKYTTYPAVGGAGGGSDGVDGVDGVDGGINAIVSATPPENPGNGTIWIEV